MLYTLMAECVSGQFIAYTFPGGKEGNGRTYMYALYRKIIMGTRPPKFAAIIREDGTILYSTPGVQRS